MSLENRDHWVMSWGGELYFVSSKSHWRRLRSTQSLKYVGSLKPQSGKKNTGPEIRKEEQEETVAVIDIIQMWKIRAWIKVVAVRIKRIGFNKTQ